MMRALENVRVLDLTAHLAGPFTTMLLADMGAEVIKIERHGTGDPSRLVEPKVQGQSSYFLFHNRNKKGIVIDLKEEKGLKIFKDFAKISDVVVENFRPGVMGRLGLDYETLKKINPRIIYASISGFGQHGPYIKRPSFDIIAQAISGWMHLTSLEPRGPRSMPTFQPVTVAGSPGDTIPGLYTACAILAALYFRELTGVGQRIDVAQMDCMITMNAHRFTPYLLTGKTAEERSKEPILELHGIYKAKDGYVVIRARHRDLKTLADILDTEENELLPPSPFLDKWVGDKTREEVVSILAEKLPCAPVLREDEVVRDPNVEERKMIVEMNHPLGFTYRTMATPIKFSETPVRVKSVPPLLGQHTEEILSTILGYSSEYIAELKEKGVI
jgi:crotonobetainyl-CoA:carnitine CoA-transferase CaiB-like acyl-CoA transferase